MLEKRLDTARQIYNACLGEGLRRLRRMKADPAWRQACEAPKGRVRNNAFRVLREGYGVREFDLIAWAGQFPCDRSGQARTWLGQHVDSQLTQVLATRAWKALEPFLFKSRGRPRFKGKGSFDSVENKHNNSGLVWRDGQVVWKIGRLDKQPLTLAPIINHDDPRAQHALSCDLCFVRLVRRKRRGRVFFNVQLVLKGRPWVDVEQMIGQGTVGLDLGPSTIAAVGPEGTFFERFCDQLKDKQREIEHLQKKLQRQARANNPDCYEPCVTKKGKQSFKTAKGKRWKVWSKGMRTTKAQIADLHRRQAAHRKALQGALVNRVLEMGDHVHLEKLSYRAFQRMWGKSVRFRAPGTFVARLRRKAESAGVEVYEFSTYTTALSQTCHACGARVKKPLSKRVHDCPCGVHAHRDLYSAFLARCVVREGDRDILDAAMAQKLWQGADPLLSAASRIHQRASGRRLSPSTRVRRKAVRQSPSPQTPVAKRRKTEPRAPPPLFVWMESQGWSVLGERRQ